jgi:hypothetical protein
MIVGDFHFVSTLLRPSETKAILLVDSDAVLSLAISREAFESVSRRIFQILQVGGGVK